MDGARGWCVTSLLCLPYQPRKAYIYETTATAAAQPGDPIFRALFSNLHALQPRSTRPAAVPIGGRGAKKSRYFARLAAM